MNYNKSEEDTSLNNLPIASRPRKNITTATLVTALPAIMQYSFFSCPSPSIAFSFEDVPHSCRKCCNTLSAGGWYYALGITPDSNTLVSGDYGTIKIWRLFSQ